MLGIHLQRSFLVLSLSSVLLAIIWANTELIFVAMKQDKLISKEAGSYAYCMIPSLFAYGILQSIMKFLQSQNIVFPMMITSGVVALFHVVFCWLLMYKIGLGSRGAAMHGNIYVLLVKCVVNGTVCEVLFILQTYMEWLLKEGSPQCP